MEDEGKKLGGKHYVLVHGACHGAWYWFKVKPLLEKAGHRVTALDMAASGIHPASIHQLHSVRDYCRPLIDFMGSLPDDQKVILVGHSLGGLNVAVIIDMFPYKIEAAVFLTAFLPDAHHHPTFVFDQVRFEHFFSSSICQLYVCLALYCLLYTSPSPRDGLLSRMPSSA